MSYKTTKDTVRKYYKYIPVPNVNITGTLTNNNNVLSGFSTSNYAKVPNFSITINASSNIEWVIKIKVQDITSSYQLIFGGSQSISGAPQVMVHTNYIRWAKVGESGTNTKVVTLDEDVYLKLTANSGTYTLYTSSDGEVWINQGTKSITSCTFETLFGCNRASYYFNGSIDLKESYIKVNNELWWEGVTVPSGIPSSYKCLSSITGGRFDTNIQMTHNTSIEAESALVANDTNWQYLIDNQSSSGSWFIVGKEQTDTPFTRHFLSSYGSLGVNPTVNQFYHFFVNMSATTKRFYIDDYLGYSTSDSSTGNFGNTLLLNHSRYKSKYFKIYNGNMELEHHIVPVKRIADNKLGWYDTMADVFYSGPWSEPITAYEELEYEEGTSSDYDFYEDVYVCKAVKETIRKYYKYGTPILNVNMVGTLTNNNGVLSGFSSSNFAKLPNVFSHGSNPWEVQFKVTTGNNVSTQGFICEQNYTGGDTYYGLSIFVGNGVLGVRCGNGPYPYWRANTGYSISANTTYWIKARFTGSQYVLTASTDGENWTTASTLNSTTIATDNQPMNIGERSSSQTYPWLGSIDLKESYIKVNNELQWEGVTYPIIEGTEQDYDFYKDVDIYKVVQEADPTPTNIGDAYEEVYTGSRRIFDAPILMTTNTPQSVSRMRLWDSGDNGVDNVWDGSGDLVIEQDFTYNGFTLSCNLLNVTKTKSSATLGITVEISDEGLGLVAQDRPRHSLVSGHSYTIRLTMNYNTRYITLEIKDNTAGTSFVQIDNYLASTYRGSKSRLIISNFGYKASTSSCEHEIDLDLNNTRVTANSAVVFQRS